METMTTESKHTPEQTPWLFDYIDDSWASISSGTTHLMTIPYKTDIHKTVAKLVIAAPATAAERDKLKEENAKLKDWKRLHEESSYGGIVTQLQKSSEENDRLKEINKDLVEALEIALWAEDNNEYLAQNEGRPRLMERLAIYKSALSKAKGQGQ